MLEQKKDINGYIGFDDDCPLYKVGEDESGWYYEYLPNADGMDGYDTAEEAMAAAEADMHHLLELDDEPLLDVLDDEGEWDAYWDAVAHERMEIAKGLL